MINVNFKKKKYFVSLIIFFFCFFLGIFFLYLERKILGISSTFHPDSKWYLNTYTIYSYLSFNLSLTKNLLNYLKFFHEGSVYSSIINLSHELKNLKILNYNNGYRNLILLNILLYSITNVLIMNKYLKYFHNKQKNYFFLISIIIFILLPYKLHLSVHVLKESFIFFFFVIYILYQSNISALVSLIFGTSFRFSFALYYLIFFNFKNLFKINKFMYLLLIFLLLIAIYYFKIYETRNYQENLFQSFLTLVNERHLNIMDGRDFDNIPHFNDYNYGFIYRSIVWPIIFLSGGFIFFTDNIFFKLLGAEILILQIITWICHKKLIINVGIILFLIIVSLWVNTFTSFYRYSYLAFLGLFLKIIFENKFEDKNKN